MTKKNCIVLIFAIAGMATNVNAQMRVGGSEIPNKSAVLDLNPDNNVSVGNATLGLGLPRVNLRNSDDAFPLSSHVKGMTIYNMATADDVTPGVYVNDGEKWLRQLDSNTPFLTVEKDSIVGNEVVDATFDGGLIRDGEGTQESPYTLGIAEGGVTTDKIAVNAVTVDKLENAPAGSILYTDENNQWKIFTRTIVSGECSVPNNSVLTKCRLKLPDDFEAGLYGVQIICDSDLPQGNLSATSFRFMADRKSWGIGTPDVQLAQLDYFDLADSHTATAWIHGAKPVMVEFFCTNKSNKDLKFKIICSWLMPF